MFAKVTTRNRLTLPKRMLDAVGSPAYFQIEIEDGRLVLTPARICAADSVRRKLEVLGITDAHVCDAVRWVRDRA